MAALAAHPSEAVEPRTESSILGTLSINSTLSRIAGRVLNSSSRFSDQPSNSTAAELASDLRLLALGSANHRHMVKDSGWAEISLAVEGVLEIADNSVRSALNNDPSAQDLAELVLKYSQACRNAVKSPISR